MNKPFTRRLLAYFVPLAMLWAWLSFGYTPRYATDTRFVLRNQQDSGLAMGATSLLGGGPEQQDLHMIREYILSPNLLEFLDRKLDLRATYSSRAILPPQRLAADASAEDLLEAYRKKITVDIDSASGIVSLRIEGFDPELLLRQTQLALAEAESHVNSAFRLIAERQADAARATLEEAKKERAAKADRLLAFQSTNSTLRPDLDSESAQAALAALEAELAAEKARKASLQTYLAAEAPSLAQSQTRIDAIEHQIELERRRLVPAQNEPKDSDAFNRQLSSYQLLQLELDLATQRYASSLESLQRAQLVASENLKSLVVVSTPFLPTAPAYPRTGVWLLVAAVVQLFTHRAIARLLEPRHRKNKQAK